MALRNTTQLPQPVGRSVPLPGNLPDLPDDVLRRFPSLRDYADNQQRVWRQLREAVRRDFDQLVLPLNKAITDTSNIGRTVREELGSFSASFEEQLTVVTTDISSLVEWRTTVEVALDDPVTGLLARVNTIEGAYVDETTATAIANSAITASLTGPSGAIFASVNSVSQALADVSGYLEGKYTLTVTAGNVVTGMNITSASGAGTNISSVTFQADHFRIYNSTTDTHEPIFELSGTDLCIRAAVKILGTLSISQVTDGVSTTALSSGLAGKISSGGAAADINANTTTISGGKITTGTITADRLSVSSLSAITANLGTITAGTINADMSITLTNGSSITALSKYGFGYTNTSGSTTTFEVGRIMESDTAWGFRFVQSSSNVGASLQFNPAAPADTRLVFHNGGEINMNVAGGDEALIYLLVPSDDTNRSIELWTAGTGTPFVRVGQSYLYNTTLDLGGPQLYRVDSTTVGLDTDVAVHGNIRKAVSDGFTVALNDGDNLIAFRYDSGSFQVRIDATTFTIPIA